MQASSSPVEVRIWLRGQAFPHEEPVLKFCHLFPPTVERIEVDLARTAQQQPVSIRFKTLEGYAVELQDIRNALVTGTLHDSMDLVAEVLEQRGKST